MRPISPSQSLPGRELWGNPAPYNLEALVDRDIARWCVRCNILAMARVEGNRPGLEEIRTRIQGLRKEIEELRKADQEKRLSRQSQVSWDAQKQHETRIARMDEIKEELLKLGYGKK